MLTVVIIAAACSSQASDKKQEAAANPAPSALPVDVRIARAIPIRQSEIIAGSIVPNRSVEIMSELPRKVTAVSFKDGSFVKQGQLLYKLDDADIRARLRQLNAELNLAQINEGRLRELLKTETVRQEEYDIALAKLQSLQAAEDVLQDELSKTFIRAPFSGIAGLTRAYAGTLVSPGLPLVSLQEQSTLKIQFTVPEKYLPYVKPGNRIAFSTELSGEKSFASVVSTEAALDMQSRNITVNAVVPNPQHALKAGMSAKVYFESEDEDAEGILISTESLIPGGSGYSVFLVKNGVATVAPVSVSNRNDTAALISAGIKDGDTIMISNILRASEGMPVSIASIK